MSNIEDNFIIQYWMLGVRYFFDLMGFYGCFSIHLFNSLLLGGERSKNIVSPIYLDS